MTRRRVTCTECGHDWPDDAGVCSWCGALIQPPSPAARSRPTSRTPRRGRRSRVASAVAVGVLVGLVAVVAVAVPDAPPPTRDLGRVSLDGGNATVLPPTRASPGPTASERSPLPVEDRPPPACTLGDSLFPCVQWSRPVGTDDVDVSVGAGAVVVAGPGPLVGVDAVTGTTRWSADIHDTRLVGQTGRTAVVATDDRVRGVDPATGRTRWEARGERAVLHGDVARGLVFSTAPTRPGHEVLRARSAATGELTATGPEVPSHARVMHAGPFVLVHDRAAERLIAWDGSSTGTASPWIAETNAVRVWPGTVTEERVLVFELVRIGRSQTRWALRSLDRATGDREWRRPVDDITLDGTDEVVVGNADGAVIGVETSSGLIRWRREGTRRLRPGPTGEHVLLATGADQKTVELVRVDDGATVWRHGVPGRPMGAARAGGLMTVWTPARLLVLDGADGARIGTVEAPVTVAPSRRPLVVLAAGRLHRIDDGRFRTAGMLDPP